MSQVTRSPAARARMRRFAVRRRPALGGDVRANASAGPASRARVVRSSPSAESNRSKRDALAQARFRSCPPTQRRRLRPGRRRVGGCSVNHCPEHPAQSDATDEEGVLRQACAADVRQPDERHEASLPRRPAAAACDRAKSVPQNETIGSRLFSFNRAANGGIASFAVEGLEARIKARFLGCLVFRTRQVH